MLDLAKEIEQVLDLLDRTYKQSSNKKKVILDKGKTVYLQIVLFKIPFTAPRKRKFLRLCHSLHGNDPEICLFVPNRKTGVEYKKTTDELIDFCVDHYTSILEKHKVKGITTVFCQEEYLQKLKNGISVDAVWGSKERPQGMSINPGNLQKEISLAESVFEFQVMPLKQLKSEYGTYELRRKLVQRFDLFLCKNSLLYNSRFLTSVGKIFRVANKEPLGVPFPKDDVDYDPEFQENIKRAIFTSSFYITRFSDNYSIPVGCLSNTKTELKENLELVLHQVFNENIIPGGIGNIRAMYVWPSQAKPVPLYISPDIPVGMKKPCIRSKRKRLRGIEGEISTQPLKKVFVTPSGEVFITNIKKDLNEPEGYDSEDDESFMDESDSDVQGVDDDDEDDDRKENFKYKDAADQNERESESECDEAIEEKEARLLVSSAGAEATNATVIEKMKRRSQSDFAKERIEKDSKVNKNNKKKSRQNGASGGSNEKLNLTKANKLKKTKEERRKMNKTKRKMLIKQEKFSKKGKTKAKQNLNY